MAKKAYIGVSKFTQPILTSNGALGGTTFAVYASNVHSATYDAFNAFSSNVSNIYSSGANPSSGAIYFTIYNPEAIKVSRIAFTNAPSGFTSSSPKEIDIQGCNDNNGWITLKSYTNTNNANGSTWYVDISSDYYKYYRIAIKSANTTEAYVNIGKISIVANTEYSVARKIKKAYIGVYNFAPRTLPSGYIQVEYIQSSGTQYIDTGFKPNNSTRVVMDVEATSSATAFYFGARTAGTTKTYTVCHLSETSIRSDFGTTQKSGTTTSVLKRTIIDKNGATCNFGDVTLSNNSSEFQGDYNLYLLTTNSAGSADASFISAKLYSCQIYDNNTLIRDYIPCTNSNGTAGLYDLANNTFYTNAGTGTFTAGQPRGSYARKIKKAYIGVGGIARPFWTGGKLAYYGKATALSATRAMLAATSIGDYALFAGGTNGSYSAVVNAYTSNLVRSTPTALSSARCKLAATSVGNYALFGGGAGSSASSTVDAYTSNLVRSTPTVLSIARSYLTAASVGDYALFGGGMTSSSDGSAVVDAYTSNLVRSTPTALSSARYTLAATSVGDYAVFGGGSYPAEIRSTVNAYNSNLVRSTPTAMSTARSGYAATSIGDYALFGGGSLGSGESAVVDAYTSNLVRSTPTALSSVRTYLAATSVGDYAVFGGGYTNSSFVKVADAYDTNLVKSTPTALSTGRQYLAATTIGDYALFGGGMTSFSAYSSVVDAYTLA